ncbi:hypothetical protein [Paenibacillus alkaliterrae]|uniref:hypothetical protein n=1 Tax=Paenibacillus alkaliterrae TaxID=320909 RepID=UPI0038B3344E
MSKVLLLTSLIASTASIAFAEPNKINEKTTEIEKLQISKQIMGDVDEYGSFYIDKNGKFVLGIAKEDSKTSDIIRDLKESFSDEEVKIEKGRKYTSQELKSINKLLSIFSEYNTDDSSITSTILTKNWVKLL